MTYRQFHNLLRVMRSIDGPELPGGVNPDNFISDPYSTFIAVPEPVSRAIWDVMVSRAPETGTAEDILDRLVHEIEDMDFVVNDTITRGLVDEAHEILEGAK